MEQMNPELRVNCPYCGAAMVYVRTDVLVYERRDVETHIYRCARHGSLILPPDGRVRQMPT